MNLHQNPDPDAPGWYPDAETGRMRRWDGRRWTGESREIPPWVPAGQRPRRRRRHWVISFAVVTFLFSLVSYKAITAGTDLPPRTVFDAAFIAQANSTCRETLEPLKAERPRPGTPEGRDPGTPKQVAAQVERVADRLAALADDLRDVPVASADQADVQTWLAEWDAYVDLGHRYATKLRAGGGDTDDVVRNAAASGRRANQFARANKLDDCTFT